MERTGSDLRLEGVSAGYGGSQAVIQGLDLSVASGEVVALLGPNGAGKTTTLLTVAGELSPSAGTVSIGGHVVKSPLHRRAKRGLGFVTEERSVFMGLTTRENLRVAGVSIPDVLAHFPELERRLDVRGGLLSGGEQQMLTLGRALARKPRLLLADELSMGLAPLVVDRLLGAVRAAADERGAAVLLVEQHVRKALKYADRAYVINRGRIVMSGTSADLLANLADVEASYLAGRA